MEDPPVSTLSERTPLVNSDVASQSSSHGHGPALRVAVRVVLFIVFLAALFVMLFFVEGIHESGERGGHGGWGGWTDRLPKDPHNAAALLLDRAPIIDGHIDLPWLVRWKYSNNVSAIELDKPTPGHVDIARLRKGKVGAFFWSVFVPCPEDNVFDEAFMDPNWSVRDTLEQIDITHLLIDKYSDVFSLARTASDVKSTISNGKIAGIIGLEGGHHLGNSLGALRTYYSLGARYMTLTHVCDNAFATSSGPIRSRDDGVAGVEATRGLSEIGRTLIQEMNRIGMLVDLSHVSDATALDALDLTRAPIIWSHSSSRTLRNIPRNVPDHVLERIGEGPDKVDAVVMVNFEPSFIADDYGEADVVMVADHVEHLAGVMGKRHVGIGSDFDGILSGPKGLEDVSKYPSLFAELLRRGWSALDLAGLSGGNLLRVMEGAERVAKQMQTERVPPAAEIYKYRDDLPRNSDEL